MTTDRADADMAALSADPARRLRELLGPATGRHVELMEKVRAHYVVTARDKQLRSEIELMIENAAMRRDPSRPHGADNRREGMALAVIAESGAGKTAAMLHYLKDNRFFPNHGIPYARCPLITVNVEAPATLAQVGMATLCATDYPAQRGLREAQAWAQVRAQLAGQGRLFLHYAEAQRIIQQKNVVERGKIVETFAGLLTNNYAPQQIILSGLPPTTNLFQSNYIPAADVDGQPVAEAHDTLRRRTRFVEFASVDLKADRRDLDRGIREIEKIAGTSLAVLGEDEMRARLCHAAARQFGLFFELIVMAIDICARERRKIVTKADFQDAYAARTREPEELNPFFADHWRAIDTSIVKRKVAGSDADGALEGTKERRRDEDE